MSYPYISRSDSDPNGDKGGLGYNTEEEADYHTDVMNKLKEEYDTNTLWDKKFWKAKPLEWRTHKQ